MEYKAPFGASDPDAGYVNAKVGQKGSAVPAEAIEHPMREIVNVIKEAGLDPDKNDLTQLWQAIQILIAAQIPEAPDKYDIGQYYPFQDNLKRSGMFPCLGGVIQRVSGYPQMLEYLSTPHGSKRLVTQYEYDELHVATWHTCADGTEIGWEGIGGVNKFVWDKDADTLRLPDLAGMMPVQIGSNSFALGDVDGDRVREAEGFTAVHTTLGEMRVEGNSNGVFKAEPWLYGSGAGSQQITNGVGIKFKLSREVPTGLALSPKRWGSNVCVYLGNKTN